MKIAVWKTGHEISDTVAEAIEYGLNAKHYVTYDPSLKEIVDYHDLHIGYGILRGMDDVFRACDKAGKPWFNMDRGYWKPGHYDGYYRISLRGTQQTFGLDKLKPDYERWDRLGIEILPMKSHGEHILFCPPTKDVANFFNYGGDQFLPQWNIKLREKNSAIPLQDDLNQASKVFTFNSSVGWEALRQGIPVVSDPTHSIVGAYQKLLDKSIHADSNARRDLFALMAGLQLQLSEIRSGKLWPLLQNLLTIN